MKLFDCNNCAFKKFSCQYVDPEEFELIRRTSLRILFRKGETIIKQGSRATHLAFLHKGIVKFNYENELGKNLILEIVSGPKLLGGTNLFFKETNLFSLVAVEQSEVCLIDAKALKRILLNNAKYSMLLFERSVELFKDSLFNYISLANKQVHGRIADILIYLWEQIYNNSDYEFTIMRREIAEFAACSPENVITTLSKLRKEGIINLTRKAIIIKDFDKLRAISKNG